MKSAFLTEMGFNGTIPHNHLNMRTEFAWMNTLNAHHFCIHEYEKVKEFDIVFIIFPKGYVSLNSVGIDFGPYVKKSFGIFKKPAFENDEEVKKTLNIEEYSTLAKYSLKDDMEIYSKPVVETLKKNNGKVCYIQEGPTTFFNDYSVVNQFNFYNQLAECDIIFAHNEYDTHFYKGLFPSIKIGTIPSLMIVDENTFPKIYGEDKAMMGGNFARWYGGFQSYLVATEFRCPIYVPSSHCKRVGEEDVPNLNILQWVMWNEWMNQLSSFKYSTTLMPTIAAGTFSMNCAYFGIPCIGNEKVDTQQELFPELSVDVNDIHQARYLAIQLREDKTFYDHTSHFAKKRVMESYHVDTQKWLEHIERIING